MDLLRGKLEERIELCQDLLLMLRRAHNKASETRLACTIAVLHVNRIDYTDVSLKPPPSIQHFTASSCTCALL